MNTNPVARNAAHAEALEAYRMSEATLFRFINHENVSNGRGTSSTRILRRLSTR